MSTYAVPPPKQYNSLSTPYQSLSSTQTGRLQNEIVSLALRSHCCKNLHILDLAGGSGTHAREALSLSASSIDVVDISESMIEVGRAVEAEHHRRRMEYHCADVMKPLSKQLPKLIRESYDIVLAIWPFDHARTLTELEGLWENIATYVKPTGLVVGVRVCNPYALSASLEKYGGVVKNIRTIPNGVKYENVFLTNPPMSFESTSMNESIRGFSEMLEKYRFEDARNVPFEDTQIVRENPGFWKEFIEDPLWVCFTARKME